MKVLHLSEIPWTTVDALDRERTVTLLPIGAVEAHGPHLPTSTDRVIARGMVEAGAERLADAGWSSLILPAVDYTAASFAADFPGTISLRPGTVIEVLVDVAAGLARHGFRRQAWANAHLDPEHLGSLYEAIRRIRDEHGVEVIFPDVTRKPWALRLTDEFKSGACHAGRYEGSIVMARRPDLVDEEAQSGLEANPSSLSRAIRDGLGSFEEAGGPQAYFGDPAAATAEEGHETLAVLGSILAEAVLAAAE